jgi:FkbM family methyltransferase
VNDPTAPRLERLRRWYLRNASRRLVEVTASALARTGKLRPEPGWRFDAAAYDPRQLPQFRRDLWQYFRDHAIDRPVIYRWYDGLRVRLFLGNDLSLCLYAGGSFEPNEFAFLRAVLRPGMVFLDGGANDGLYSLYAARRVAPDGRVLAIEPSTREFQRLEANLILNRLSSVDALNVALGREVGEATLSIAEAGHEGQNTIGDRVSNPKVATKAHETMRLETIDVLVEQLGLSRLDFVKLDVEGSEIDALEGARSAIARFQPLMLLEAEDERLASQHRTKQDLFALMKEIEYELWVFDRDTAQLRPARPPDEPEGNTIAAPAGWVPPAV